MSGVCNKTSEELPQFRPECLRTSARIRSHMQVRSTVKMLAEMRKHPGGSAQDTAVFATVQTGG